MHIHFIAIGGSAMHNLALALHEAGNRITGSDDEIFDPAKSRLEAKGILPAALGWYPEMLSELNPDAVILGMHAKKDNPELLKALELKIPVYSYPEYLYEAYKNKTRVVIGGSHGKTTITSMILHVLKDQKIGVDFMVGALLKGFDTMVSIKNENKIAVIEGDEYLTSPIDLRPKFHLYMPDIATISGIAWDHINVFPTFENYKEQFSIFINKIVSGGVLIYNREDAIVQEVVDLCARKDIVIKGYTTPEFSIENGSTVLHTEFGRFTLKIFGKHNLQNLACAREVCLSLGVDSKAFYTSISTFEGAAKRLELLALSANSVAYKDFAHSPSKLKATIQALKEQFPERTLLACMELHTYSSLNRDFFREYKGSMSLADIKVVYYSAHALQLKGLPNLSAEDIKAGFDDSELIILSNKADLENFILSHKKSHTNLLLMSSGNWDGMNQVEIGERFVN